VVERDSVVDKMGEKILDELTRFLHDEHDGVKRALHIMRIAHNLERIADLSTNICEEVIYIVEGKDVKHHHHG
jgi:phosphate transport system protein